MACPGSAASVVRPGPVRVWAQWLVPESMARRLNPVPGARRVEVLGVAGAPPLPEASSYDEASPYDECVSEQRTGR